MNTNIDTNTHQFSENDAVRIHSPGSAFHDQVGIVRRVRRLPNGDVDAYHAYGVSFTWKHEVRTLSLATGHRLTHLVNIGAMSEMDAAKYIARNYSKIVETPTLLTGKMVFFAANCVVATHPEDENIDYLRNDVRR